MKFAAWQSIGHSINRRKKTCKFPNWRVQSESAKNSHAKWFAHLICRWNDVRESIDKISGHDNRLVSDQLPLAQLLAYWLPEPPLEPPTALCATLHSWHPTPLCSPDRPTHLPMNYGVECPSFHPAAHCATYGNTMKLFLRFSPPSAVFVAVSTSQRLDFLLIFKTCWIFQQQKNELCCQVYKLQAFIGHSTATRAFN